MQISNKIITSLLFFVTLIRVYALIAWIKSFTFYRKMATVFFRSFLALFYYAIPTLMLIFVWSLAFYYVFVNISFYFLLFFLRKIKSSIFQLIFDHFWQYFFINLCISIACNQLFNYLL